MLWRARYPSMNIRRLFTALVILGFLYIFLAPMSSPVSSVSHAKPTSTGNTSAFISVTVEVEEARRDTSRTKDVKSFEHPIENIHDSKNVTAEPSMAAPTRIMANHPPNYKKPEKKKTTASTKKEKKKPPNYEIPANIKKALKDSTIIGTLDKYSRVLYLKSKRAISEVNITTAPRKVMEKKKPELIKQHSMGFRNFAYNPIHTICHHNVSNETKLVMFTSMFHSISKQYLFNNTLTNYAALKPFVHPILYICDFDIIELSGYLVHRACAIGWSVIACPRRTKYGFPILNSMYYHSMHLFKHVRWFGYANADILFTSRLITALELVDTSSYFSDITFISSLRTNAYLEPGEKLENLATVESLAQRNDSKLHKPQAIDYFIYRRDARIFYSMPDYCTGRRGFDQWLLYFEFLKKTKTLDITETSPAFHIAIKGVSFATNSHASLKNESEYNMYISTGALWTGGDLRCLSKCLKHVPEINHTDYVWMNKKQHAQLSILKKGEYFNFTTFAVLNITEEKQRTRYEDVVVTVKEINRTCVSEIETLKVVRARYDYSHTYTSSKNKVNLNESQLNFPSLSLSTGRSNTSSTHEKYDNLINSTRSTKSLRYMEAVLFDKSHNDTFSSSGRFDHIDDRNHTLFISDLKPSSNRSQTSAEPSQIFHQLNSAEICSVQKKALIRRERGIAGIIKFNDYRTYVPPKPVTVDIVLNATRPTQIDPAKVEYLFNKDGENILLIMGDKLNGSYIVHTHTEYMCPIKHVKVSGQERVGVNARPKVQQSSSTCLTSVHVAFLVLYCQIVYLLFRVHR